MKRILVLCTGNSARSQMGEGLFRHECRGIYEVASAGTNPSYVRPEAVAVMKELGIDISGQRSKSVKEFEGQSFDYVVTVCDNARQLSGVFGRHRANSLELRGPRGRPGQRGRAVGCVSPYSRSDSRKGEDLFHFAQGVDRLHARYPGCAAPPKQEDQSCF
jgi:protein-tyrosine-phosphatase